MPTICFLRVTSDFPICFPSAHTKAHKMAVFDSFVENPAGAVGSLWLVLAAVHGQKTDSTTRDKRPISVVRQSKFPFNDSDNDNVDQASARSWERRKMVTDKQVRRLFALVKTEQNQEIAAAKAGMDAKTARKYLRLGQVPTELPVLPRGRTRPDSFGEVWEEVRQLLQVNPGLEAKAVFEHLQRCYPGQFSDGQLRTFQPRVKAWRATEGPAKEVFFAQQHVPGRLSASDFTHMDELGITVQGQSFPHLIYHFVLTYSNWEAGTVCFSESFESLCEGLQNAVWELGKVPHRHRTDRLSTAVNNMTNPAEFTDRYQALLRYYGIEEEKTQARQAHENGDVEQRHFWFKRAVEQELLLRGSRDFGSVDDYKRFLKMLLERLTAERRARLAVPCWLVVARRNQPRGPLTLVRSTFSSSASSNSTGTNVCLMRFSLTTSQRASRPVVLTSAFRIRIWSKSRSA